MPISLTIYINGVHMSDQLRIGVIEAGGTKMVLAIGTIEGEIVERGSSNRGARNSAPQNY